MATAELAVAMPAVMLLLVWAVSALGLAVDQIRCVDAATATARSLARGDPRPVAVDAGLRLAPGGAAIEVSSAPATVRVSVSTQPRWALAWMGSRGAPRGTAVAALEAATPSQAP